MQTVLTRTAIGIVVAVFINAIAYFIIEDEIIVIFSKIALCCAVPIILGYLSCAFLDYSYNTIIYIFSFSLLAVNVFLITFSSVLLLFAFFFGGISVLLSFSYLAVGYYVFYETLQNTGSTPIKNNQKMMDFQDDILDDNL